MGCFRAPRPWRKKAPLKDPLRVTLLALQKNSVNIFSCLPGNFALKNDGDFWWIFSRLRLPRNETQTVLEKIGENSERNSGQNSGRKFEKFGKLSFCNFSDLIKSLVWSGTFYRGLNWKIGKVMFGGGGSKMHFGGELSWSHSHGFQGCFMSSLNSKCWLLGAKEPWKHKTHRTCLVIFCSGLALRKGPPLHGSPS